MVRILGKLVSRGFSQWLALLTAVILVAASSVVLAVEQAFAADGDPVCTDAGLIAPITPIDSAQFGNPSFEFEKMVMPSFNSSPLVTGDPADNYPGAGILPEGNNGSYSVTYRFYFENTGDVPLKDFRVDDPILGYPLNGSLAVVDQWGGSYSRDFLGPGERGYFETLVFVAIAEGESFINQAVGTVSAYDKSVDLWMIDPTTTPKVDLSYKDCAAAFVRPHEAKVEINKQVWGVQLDSAGNRIGSPGWFTQDEGRIEIIPLAECPNVAPIWNQPPPEPDPTKKYACFRYDINNTGTEFFQSGATVTDSMANVTCPPRGPMFASDPMTGAAPAADPFPGYTQGRTEDWIHPGDTLTCSGTALWDQATANNLYTSSVTLDGTAGPYEGPVTQVSASDILTAEFPKPGVGLVKKINGMETADQPVEVPMGQDLDVTFEITNSGNVELTNLNLTDDVVTDPTKLWCQYTDLGKAVLQPGDTLTCSVRIPNPGPGVLHKNEAKTEANGILYEAVADVQVRLDYMPPPEISNFQPVLFDTPVSDIATAQALTTATAGIDLKKFINGQDANEAPGPRFQAGDAMAISIVVTNTGNIPLTGVTVKDDPMPVTGVFCPKDSLAAGESMTCIAAAFAPADGGQHSDTATVTAKGMIDGVENAFTDADLAYATAVPTETPVISTTTETVEMTAPAVTVTEIVRGTETTTQTQVGQTTTTVTEAAATVTETAPTTTTVTEPSTPGIVTEVVTTTVTSTLNQPCPVCTSVPPSTGVDKPGGSSDNPDGSADSKWWWLLAIPAVAGIIGLIVHYAPQLAPWVKLPEWLGVQNPQPAPVPAPAPEPEPAVLPLQRQPGLTKGIPPQ